MLIRHARMIFQYKITMYIHIWIKLSVINTILAAGLASNTRARSLPVQKPARLLQHRQVRDRCKGWVTRSGYAYTYINAGIVAVCWGHYYRFGGTLRCGEPESGVRPPRDAVGIAIVRTVLIFLRRRLPPCTVWGAGSGRRGLSSHVH